MTYGGVHYELFASGSTSYPNASTNLFGDYQGLSLLNQDEVVEIGIVPLNNNAFFINASKLGDEGRSDHGVRVPGQDAASSITELKPMRVRNASTLIAITSASVTNGSGMWFVWTQHR
jgi:hypothetical protein